MKTLLTFFVLLFSSSVVAEDISDFQIDGMSVGDSLLDYFSEKEITSADQTNYPKSKKYFEVWFTSINNLYSEFSISLKEGDNKYIIYGVRGVKNFKNNFKECKTFKKNATKEIKLLFPNILERNYEFVYEDVDDGKSIAYITDFELSKGSVRIYCQNWSSVTEEARGWFDEGRIGISTNEYLDWLVVNGY